MNPAYYNLLAAAPAPDGVRGLLTQLNPTAGATPETFTLACTTAPSTFSVTGSVSGSMPTLTVGVPYIQPQVSMLLEQGTQLFTTSDTYTVALTSAGL
jgi:hypothetical protein